MKLLVLHMSDSHFGSDNKISTVQLKEVVKSIKVVGEFEDILLVFSGDVSNSCNEEEYKLAKRNLNFILKGLSKKYLDSRRIKVIIAPGNHDIEFEKEKVNREEITEALSSGKSSKLVKQYLIRMKNFFDFSKQYGSFQNDNFVDIHKHEYNHKTLSIVNINSALFSLYKDENKDNDRGLHYIPEDSLKRLDRFKHEDLNISLMHHSPRFFEEKIEKHLNAFLHNNVELCLYGHEHSNDFGKSVNSTENVLYNRCGGPFSDYGVSIFNAIVIDLDKKSYEAYKFTWNSTHECYEHEQESLHNEVIEDKSRFIRQDYLEKISSFDELVLGAKHDDIYVFPELILNEGEFEKETKVSDFITLKNKLKEKSFCIIKGSDMCGKSSLAKELFLSYSKTKHPVLFAPETINGKRIGKIIEDTYKEEYINSQYSYSQFMQLDRSERLAIVDDLHMIDDLALDEFISSLSDVFGLVIFVTDNSNQFNVFENAKSEFQDDDSLKFKISPMYYSKRMELISKVVKFKNPHMSEREERRISEMINKSIKDQLNLINLEPNFVVFYVNTFLANAFQQGGSNIFNSVFVSNITNQMQRDKKIDIPSTLYILQLLAFFIHVNKEYPLSQTSYSKIIDDYNTKGKGKRKPINGNDLLSRLINVKILRYTIDNRISFSNNNFLSYFVAKEILRNYMLDSDMTNIKYITENVCFGINGDILLFLCYLIDNKEILKHVLKEANEFYKEIEEFSFDKGNITYTVKKYTKIDIALPDEKDKKMAVQRIEEQEKVVKGSQRLNVVNIYDYDETKINERSSQISKGMKYIEILSKTLPDFVHLLDGDEIEELVGSIYTHPNKLLYFVLKPFDVLFELDTDELNRLLLDNGSTENYSKEEIDSFKSVLMKTSSTLILNILDLASRLSTTEQTIFSLESHNYKEDTNHSIINAMSYENLGKTEDLGRRLETIADGHKKNEYLITMLKRIFAKHCTFNSIRYVGYTQHLVDRFLKVKGSKMQNIRLGRRK